MHDFLDILAKDARRTVESGYYETLCRTFEYELSSLKDKINKCEGNPVIAEIKLSSPSIKSIRRDLDVVDTASAIHKGGAVGISILTEPKNFMGSLRNFQKVREVTSIPLLMKDFIISQNQIDAAFRIGADAILLIQALFDRGYCDSCLDEMIEYAHSHGIEVLLEAHTENEFQRATYFDADLLGINNRDLRTLTVDLHVTEDILKKQNCPNRIIVSESGIEFPRHIHFLRNAGAKAFLVGTAVMSAHNVKEKVRELVEA